MPRLAPIVRPSSIPLRLAHWFSRRQTGTVISAITVFYSRFSALMGPQWKMLKLAEKLSIDQRLRVLLEIHVSAQNGCAFCGDLHRADALHRGIPLADVRAAAAAVGDDAASRIARHAGFSNAERAALGYVRAMARSGGPVTDDDFAWLADHFDERQIVEITWCAAFTGYLNAMAKALELRPDGVCPVPFPDALPSPA